MAEIKAIIFDFDGVLADSVGKIYEINQVILERLGFPKFASFEDFKERFGHYEDFYTSLDPSDPDLLKKTEKIFFEILGQTKERAELFDGVADVVKELSKRYKLGIVSHNFREAIEDTLRRGGVDKFFSSIVDNRVENIKPHPDHVLICAKQLGAMPEEVIMIGDAPIDVEAAKRAGFAKVIGVLYGQYTEKYLIGADSFVRSPGEILEAVNGASNG